MNLRNIDILISFWFLMKCLSAFSPKKPCYVEEIQEFSNESFNNNNNQYLITLYYKHNIKLIDCSFSNLHDINLNLVTKYSNIYSYTKLNSISYILSIQLNTINLINFKGFLLDSYFGKTNDLFFMFSKIDFYYNETKVNSDCGLILQLNSPLNKDFISFYKGTKYSKKYCIEIFSNDYKNSLRLYSITKTFIRENSFEFIKDNRTKMMNGYDKICLELYNINLDFKILNKYLFGGIQSLVIRGFLKKIDPNLFEPFQLISQLVFDLENYKMIFHNSLYFLESITQNNQTSINIFFLNTESYTFPDEDFCVFAKTVLNRNLFFFITRKERVNCSCLFLFITNNSYSANAVTDLYSEDDDLFLHNNKHYNDFCLNRNNGDCNISFDIYQCNITNKSFTPSMIQYDYQIANILYTFEFLTKIIITPMLNSIGIAICIIILITLGNKNKKKNCLVIYSSF